MTTYYYLLYILCRMRPRRRRGHACARPPRTPTSGTPVALSGERLDGALMQRQILPASRHAGDCLLQKHTMLPAGPRARMVIEPLVVERQGCVY